MHDQIIVIIKNIFIAHKETFTDITHSYTKDDLVIHVQIPVEKAKITTIRIIVNNQLLTNIEDLEISLNTLIDRKIKSSRKLFGNLYKIENGHCAWVLKS